MPTNNVKVTWMKKQRLATAKLGRRSRGASRWSIVRTLSVVAAISMLTTACAGSGSDDGGEGGTESGPFIYYVNLGLSGASSSYTPALAAGLKAASETINANGGILGRKVKLVTDNNESNATKATSLLQEQLRENKPDLVWAGSSDSETLPMAGLLAREKIIGFSPGSSTELGKSEDFPYYFSASVQTAAIAKYLAESLAEKGYKTVGQLSGTDAFGQNVTKEYKAAFEEAGLSVVAETYEPDAVEMDGPLARIKDGDPDAVVFTDFLHPQYVLKSRVKNNMTDIPFVGDLSSTVTDLSATLSPEESQNLLLTSYKLNTTGGADSSDDRPGVQALLASLKKDGVDIQTTLTIFALAYDATLAYANAVEAAGTTDPDKVRAAMEDNKGDTYPLALADDLGWTKENHISDATGLFTSIPPSPLKNGQFTLSE